MRIRAVSASPAIAAGLCMLCKSEVMGRWEVLKSVSLLHAETASAEIVTEREGCVPEGFWLYYSVGCFV